MVKRYVILSLLTVGIMFSCDDENNNDLPPVEERVENAIASLRADLTAPVNGWRLQYQPTPESGIFFMLLKFTPGGDVNIKSDVADNNGEFFDQTITYRIDNALGLELIMETFSVFHHLFELDQATFGAEFEFLFKTKENNNLLFESISDFSNPTQLVFEPATVNDESLFALDISQNLNAFGQLSPQVFGGIAPSQQIVLQNRNISVFWTIDITKRSLIAEFALIGTTPAEVIAGNGINLNHASGYTIQDGRLVLLNPLSFVLNGQQNNVSELSLNTFSMDAASLCPTAVVADNPKYIGFSPGIGPVTMLNSLLSTRGSAFQNSVYSVNAQFVFDGNGQALTDGGSIGTKFPTATGFVLFYGVQLNNPNIPIYSVGLIFDDGNVFVREFQPTSTKINLVQLTFLDQFFFSGTSPAPGTNEDLKAIIDEIFAGGEVYAFDFPVNGATVFRLFNPCNRYEVFLVQ